MTSCKESSLLFSQPPRKLYDYLKQIYCSKFKPHFNLHNDVTIHDPTQIAEIFNHYFNSTFTTTQFTLTQVSKLPAPLFQLSSIEISRSDVFEVQISLDKTKAVGCDSIHLLILKPCAISLIEPFFHILFLHNMYAFTLAQSHKNGNSIRSVLYLKKLSSQSQQLPANFTTVYSIKSA